MNWWLNTRRLCASLLVGYFFKTWPSMLNLRKSFEIIGFKGSFQLGLLNQKHVLIRFDLDEDYLRCWNKQTWTIHGCVMRVTKCTPNFKPNVESPVITVWLGFEELPIHLRDQRALFDTRIESYHFILFSCDVFPHSFEFL
ncbi:unnamed protein product [Cuscuta europaea]|uniref:DUF4283 domain-containing protein n=1 Tax=Cuscuta europaea TaxID=41803 RepID=A0A9P0ZZ38_CUSEU|nr:unnamed protein product [Cuscuta europaea]